ncbi:MAG TPA: hypothetical protein VL523_02595 [Terriglobia bacterium]|nr:hypothetical protein [Terriglobia bacterium]
MKNLNRRPGMLPGAVQSKSVGPPLHPGLKKRLSMVLMLLALPFVVAVSLHAQKSRAGQPVIATGTQSSAPDALYLDVAEVDPNPNDDICKRIANTWHAFGQLNGANADSAVIDARSIRSAPPATTLACDSDPFMDPVTKLTTSHHGVLLLGNQLIQTTVPWMIPSFIQVEGLGETLTSKNAYNTTLQAAPNYSYGGYIGNPTICAANSLVCLGHGVQSFRAQIRHLTVDCNFVNSCIGVYNGAAEEGSYAQDVTITNAPAAGLEVNLAQFTGGGGGMYNGAVNSGPYRNITIDFTGSCANICTASTVGVLVENTGSMSNYGGVVRAFDGVTVSGANAGATLGQGILIEGASTQVTNSHVEYFPTSIQIGADGVVTNGVELANLFLSNTNTGTGVSIVQDQASLKTGDVFITGLNFEGPEYAVIDQVGGKSLKDCFIAIYAVGHMSGSSNAVVISTSPYVAGGHNSVPTGPQGCKQ